ncbi:unnamed protein product [Moneuplotes crassus]|uniref:Uncharacterized protein n=1 Tax=Euplotes crassus TaxID=5936 RepID=A0AAD1Y3U7_EUPCR|nr:unnamed protein product [Moneuplotes crassus]
MSMNQPTDIWKDEDCMVNEEDDSPTHSHRLKETKQFVNTLLMNKGDITTARKLECKLDRDTDRFSQKVVLPQKISLKDIKSTGRVCNSFSDHLNLISKPSEQDTLSKPHKAFHKMSSLPPDLSGWKMVCKKKQVMESPLLLSRMKEGLKKTQGL